MGPIGTADVLIGPMRLLHPRLGLLVLPLLLAAWPAGTGQALAHASLVGSNPAAGTDLRAAPTSLRLTFSDGINATGTAIQVTDASGAQLQLGEPVVNDTVVTQRLKATTTPGTVRVVWRVTSSDGHPATGNFNFSVDAAAASTRSPDTSAGRTAGTGSSSATGGLERSSGSTSDDTSYSTSVPTFQRPTDRTNNEPLLIIVLTVAALIVVGGVAALIRLRSRDDDSDL